MHRIVTLIFSFDNTIDDIFTSMYYHYKLPVRLYNVYNTLSFKSKKINYFIILYILADNSIGI